MEKKLMQFQLLTDYIVLDGENGLFHLKTPEIIWEYAITPVELELFITHMSNSKMLFDNIPNLTQIGDYSIEIEQTEEPSQGKTYAKLNLSVCSIENLIVAINVIKDLVRTITNIIQVKQLPLLIGSVKVTKQDIMAKTIGTKSVDLTNPKANEEIKKAAKHIFEENNDGVNSIIWENE